MIGLQTKEIARDPGVRSSNISPHSSFQKFSKPFVEKLASAIEDSSVIVRNLDADDQQPTIAKSIENVKSSWRRASIAGSTHVSLAGSKERLVTSELRAAIDIALPDNAEVYTRNSENLLPKSFRRSSISECIGPSGEIGQVRLQSPGTSPRAIIKKPAKPAVEKLSSPLILDSAETIPPRLKPSPKLASSSRSLSPPPIARRIAKPAVEKLSSALDDPLDADDAPPVPSLAPAKIEQIKHSWRRASIHASAAPPSFIERSPDGTVAIFRPASPSSSPRAIARRPPRPALEKLSSDLDLPPADAATASGSAHSLTDLLTDSDTDAAEPDPADGSWGNSGWPGPKEGGGGGSRGHGTSISYAGGGDGADSPREPPPPAPGEGSRRSFSASYRLPSRAPHATAAAAAAAAADSESPAARNLPRRLPSFEETEQEPDQAAAAAAARPLSSAGRPLQDRLLASKRRASAARGPPRCLAPGPCISRGRLAC